MCRTADDVKFFGRAKLGDPTAGMTDSEQAAYWRASRDRMAAQNMELGAKLAQARKALEPFASLADDVDRFRHEDDSTCPHRLKAGDLRRARAALSLAKDSRS